MTWAGCDAASAPLGPDDLVVGDTGKVYSLCADQYSTGGGFIRVNPVSMRRGRWVVDKTAVTGQHGSCVVRITPRELEEFAHMGQKPARQRLVRFFYGRYPSRAKRAEFLERQRARKGMPKRLVEAANYPVQGRPPDLSTMRVLYGERAVEAVLDVWSREEEIDESNSEE